MAKKTVVEKPVFDETIVPESANKDFEGHVIITQSDDPRAKLGAYHDMPYAIFHYPPERQCHTELST